MRALTCISAASAAVILFFSACDGIGPVEIPIPGDDAGPATGGKDPGTDDAGVDAEPDAEPDAGVSPVLVAITPTPASSYDMPPTPAGELEADLATFGAGARAAVVVLPWDELPSGEDPALQQRIDFYSAHQRRVVVNLAVVDRLADHRPASIAGEAWNAPDAIEAAHQAIDTAFEAGGAAIRFLTIGRDVDVYLAAHADERAAFTAFAKDACAYAKGHAGAADDFAAGVALSPAAPKSEPAFTQLLDAGDVVAFSFFPGLGTYEPDAASNAGAALSALADAVPSKPIVLQAAGVPTDGLAGGSEASQQAFFAALFGAIDARRSSFALVDVVELHDAPHDACAAWAASQGEPVDGPFAAYACSLGVWTSDGTPKAAWSAVIAGSAALSSP